MADRNPLDYYKRQYRQGAAKESQRGDEAWSRMRTFDPYADMGRAARAQWNTFSEDLGEGLEDIRGSQVGRGRLRTGFGYEDEDRFTRDSLDRFYNQLASQAWRAPALNLQNTSMMAPAIDRGYDLVTAGADLTTSEMDREAAERASKRDMWGNIIGGTLGFAGKALNPFGLFG
jgi:hypothetical protein